MRLWWRYHTVHPGDTLASLARNYHTTAKSIVAANHLDGTELEADAKSVIPVAPGKHPLSDTATYARRITRYRIHSGDTVESVADNFRHFCRRCCAAGTAFTATVFADGEFWRCTCQSHRARIRRSGVFADEVEALICWIEAQRDSHRQASARPSPPKIEQPAGRTSLRHKVKHGETLYSIATAYRTSVAALKRDNRNVAILRPGMILIVQPVS